MARDGLVNLASGAGTTADKRSFAFYTPPFILPEQIEAVYRSSWMMKKGINLPPKDMTRKGRAWQIDEDSVDLIEKEERRLGLWAKLRQALILGRLGGGLLVLGVGGEDPETPLGDAARGKGSLRYINVMNRWQVATGPKVLDPRDDLFGQPAYFEMRFGGVGVGTGSVRIHPSRVVAFRGEPIPELWGGLGDEWFWGDPLVLSVQDAVKNADAAMNGFASLIEEAKVDTVSIPGLTAMLATTAGEELVQKRISIANSMKSMHNTRILDGGKGKDSPGEEWDTRQVTWAGMPDMIAKYVETVAASFDIPVTRFFNTSPKGMNATGDSDTKNYHEKIASDQEDMLRPALDHIDKILLPSAGVTITDEATFTFPPLAEPSDADKADLFGKKMVAITALQATGTIPAIAFDKAVQHTAVEEGWLAGLDGALEEVPEGERFPSEIAEAPELDANGNPIDPSAEGGDQQSLPSAGNSPNARRRAANGVETDDA